MVTVVGILGRGSESFGLYKWGFPEFQAPGMLRKFWEAGRKNPADFVEIRLHGTEL